MNYSSPPQPVYSQPVAPMPPPPPAPGGINREGLHKFLSGKGWPQGMITAVEKSCAMFPLRFFIVDDSGSMSTNDGHRMIGTGRETR
jgi:hypothetical protein